MRNTTLLALLNLSFALFVVGCGEDPVPVDPSFATDVRPIMIARCVRCHGAGGKLNGDPLSKMGAPPELIYLEHYDDTGNCAMGAPAGACMPGAKTVAGLIKLYVHDKGVNRMPPLPAETLSDRQLEIIDLWAAKTPPKP